MRLSLSSLRACATPLSAVLLGAMLAACAGMTPKAALVHQEDFGAENTHSRVFSNSAAHTCEAARRALLSQGYVINAAGADQVIGRKNFQPESETHVEVEFRVVCAPDGRAGRNTIAFASALQDRYALKKSNNSASLGVGVLGSVSLPFSSSDDALVKVASETLEGERLYDRFFMLMERYLMSDVSFDVPPAAASVPLVAPLPAPAPASAPASAPVPAAAAPGSAPVPAAAAPALAPVPAAAAPASAPVPAAGASGAASAPR